MHADLFPQLELLRWLKAAMEHPARYMRLHYPNASMPVICHVLNISIFTCRILSVNFHAELHSECQQHISGHA